MEIDIDVNIKGAIWEGRAPGIIDMFKTQLEDVLGDIAVSRIRAYLPTQYMYLGHNGGDPRFNPVPANAGTYAAGIHTERQTQDAVLVHDTPVVYGPWLEGVSTRNLIVWPHKRNPPPRRFPGYHTFRKIADTLNADAEGIAKEVIPPYIGALNA